MALKLGEILIKQKLISQEEFDKAMKVHHVNGEHLGTSLVKLGLIKEEDLLRVLSEQMGIPFQHVNNMVISEKIVKKVPAKFVWYYKFIPLELDGNVLTIALSNPLDLSPLDDIKSHLGYEVRVILALQVEIQDLIKKYYGVGAETIEEILSKTPKDAVTYEKTEVAEDIEKMAEDASVIKLVNQILKGAIEDRATDIHLETYREEATLRYRVDGVLYPMKLTENIRYLYAAVISRVKIMSALDVVERRRPQDGRAKIKIGQMEWDLRISIIPTLYGEHLVIRILPINMLFSLEDLGMRDGDLEKTKKLISRPNGIIFLTGPTGSGKTTTLYAALSRLNTPERKIITIEDPVEYELKGITQIQVNPKIGLTFSQGLRSVLRHDPDVMMVGEVRDLETAETAIRVALTGHLVFSTLHTNDAASGVTRLLDMGIEPFLIASSVGAFIAQRLIRLVCQKCKVEETKKETPDGKLITIFKGKGCDNCKSTGYRGRTGIHEILQVNERIKELIVEKASAMEIRKEARKNGMKTLRESGWEKIALGVTTPEEIFQIAQEEE